MDPVGSSHPGTNKNIAGGSIAGWGSVIPVGVSTDLYPKKRMVLISGLTPSKGAFS